MAQETLFELITFTENDAQTFQSDDISDLFGKLNPKGTNWLNIINADEKLLERLNEQFNFHHLLVEDILQKDQLPKAEEFEDTLLFTLKMLKINEKNRIIDEQLSIVLQGNTIITFQEVEGDVFGLLRERIATGTGRVRKRQADYLFARLLNAVIQNYSIVLEHLRIRIDNLEETVMAQENEDITSEVLEIRKKISFLRRMMFPLEDAISKVQEDGTAFIKKTTIAYMRDVYDQTRQLHASFDSFRDALASLMDLHMSNLSQNMNNIMKTLTVISAIFIPLTFLAGIYGMNFENIPELRSPNGYFILLGVMAVLTVSMVIYMRFKKWF